MGFSGLRLLPAVLLSLVLFPLASSEAGAQDAAQKPPATPELRQRPAENKTAVMEGRMRLDVVVTDAAGNPITGLEAKDFRVLDDNQALAMLSFRAVGGTQGKTDSRVSLFLIMDTVNSGLLDIPFMRDEVERFLRQNDGHLTHPVTVVLFTDAGMQLVGKTSLDGNALAEAVHAVKPPVHTIHSAAGGEALVERYQISVKALAMLVAREVPVAGRKMLLWIGPGWPVLRRPDTNFNSHSEEMNFNVIASLTNQLRQARLVVCSAGGGTEFRVADLLKPVKMAKDASAANLAVQVVAIHSGGRTLDGGNRSRPAEQLNGCVQEIGAYYTLTFDPPQGEKAFTYHGLKVTVDKPGVKVNTTAGYYAEP